MAYGFCFRKRHHDIISTLLNLCVLAVWGREGGRKGRWQGRKPLKPIGFGDCSFFIVPGQKFIPNSIACFMLGFIKMGSSLTLGGLHWPQGAGYWYKMMIIPRMQRLYKWHIPNLPKSSELINRMLLKFLIIHNKEADGIRWHLHYLKTVSKHFSYKENG